MIPYILKSSLSLLLLFGLYWFLLRKEKLFVFNRYFLIFSIVFSLVIPFVSIQVNFHINEARGNLITALNSNLKEAGTVNWRIPNKRATNETGFTARPGGLRKYNGEFTLQGEHGIWWTTSEENDFIGFVWILTYNDSRVNPGWPSKRDGFSVRCIKDYSTDSSSTSISSPNTTNMVDFSGKWVFDRSQSNSFLADVASSTIIILQDKNSITMDITITPDKNKPVNRTEKYVYNKSIVKKTTQGDKLTVIICTPSPDGQSFSITETLSYTQNGIEKVTKRVSVYSLGKDGKTLIINQEDFLPEGSITPANERHETRIYDKLN